MAAVSAMQKVMPVTWRKLHGQDFVDPHASDVYFVFFSARDLADRNNQGMSNYLKDDATVKASMQIFQLLLAHAKQLSCWYQHSAIETAVVGATPVPTEGGTGVLFMFIFNGPTTVTMERQRTADEARARGENRAVSTGAALVDAEAGEEGGEGEGEGEAPAPRNRSKRGGPSTEYPRNMTDVLWGLTRRENMTPAQQRLAGPRPDWHTFNDLSLATLANRAFPEQRILSNSVTGFTSKHYQLQRGSPCALDTVLGLDATLGLLRRANAADIFINRGSYSFSRNRYNFSPELGFRELRLRLAEPADVPNWAFPWSLAPTGELLGAIAIEMHLLRDDPDFLAIPAHEERERQLFALYSLLGKTSVTASAAIDSLRTLRKEVATASSETRARMVKQLEEARARRGEHFSPDDLPLLFGVAQAAERAVHNMILNRFVGQLATHLSPNNSALPNIAKVMRDLARSSECANPQRRPRNAETRVHCWSAPTPLRSTLFKNISVAGDTELRFFFMIERFGGINTHRLVRMLIVDWGTVFLMLDLFNNTFIIGTAARGKSVSVRLCEQIFCDIVRDDAYVTAGAETTPGDDFVVSVCHEVDLQQMRPGFTSTAKAVSDGGRDRTANLMDPNTREWKHRTVKLPRNVQRTKLANPDSRGGVTSFDPALAQRYYFINAEASARFDDAAPHIGAMPFDDTRHSADFRRMRVRACAAGVINLIVGMLLQRTGKVAQRLFTKAQRKVLTAPQVMDTHRNARRIENAAEVRQAYVLAAMLFDYEHSPFFDAAFSFSELVWAVQRLFYIWPETLFYCATERADADVDEHMILIKRALLDHFFPEQAAIERGAESVPRFKGRYVRRDLLPHVITGDELPPDDRKDAFAGAAAAAADSVDPDDGAQVDRTRVAAALSLPFEDWYNITSAGTGRTRNDRRTLDGFLQSGNNAGERGASSAPTGPRLGSHFERNRRLDGATAAIVQELRHGRHSEALQRMSDDVLQTRIRAALSTDVVCETGGAAPRRHKALEVIHNNAVFSLQWLLDDHINPVAEAMLSLMQFEHTVPRRILTGNVNSLFPMMPIHVDLKRRPGVKLVLPAIVASNAYNDRLMSGGDVDLNNAFDNPWLKRPLPVTSDLETAAFNEHMRVNGWTPDDYVMNGIDLRPLATPHAFQRGMSQEATESYPDDPRHAYEEQYKHANDSAVEAKGFDFMDALRCEDAPEVDSLLTTLEPHSRLDVSDTRHGVPEERPRSPRPPTEVQPHPVDFQEFFQSSQVRGAPAAERPSRRRQRDEEEGVEEQLNQMRLSDFFA